MKTIKILITIKNNFQNFRNTFLQILFLMHTKQTYNFIVFSNTFYTIKYPIISLIKTTKNDYINNKL